MMDYLKNFIVVEIPMYLSLNEIEEIVSENLYTYDGNQNYSRLMEGFYDYDLSLPALSIPGGDMGQFAVLFSAGFTYGFEIDYQKAWDLLHKMVGGNAHFSYPGKASTRKEAYRYAQYISEAPEQFNLDSTSKDEFFTFLKKNEIVLPEFTSTKLQKESALIIMNGDEGIQSSYSMQTNRSTRTINLLVYHQTLANNRLKRYSDLLLEKSVVKLHEGLEAEYLYEVLLETQDVHLYSTLACIDRAMPIFSVSASSSSEKVGIEQYQ